MHIAARIALSVVVISTAALLLFSGCSKEEEGDKAAKEEFRIPDSLLAPFTEIRLLRDDYHPVDGGVMADERIELHYPPSSIARYVALSSFDLARKAYDKVSKEIGKPSEGMLVLIGTADLEEYRFLTRKEWWYYGFVRGDTIYFEPLDIMLKRTIADEAITQKIAQAALLRRSNGRMPVWLREALASRIADEREIIMMQVEQFKLQGLSIDPPPEVVEESLTAAIVMADTRIAFGAAFRMLESLLESYEIEDIMKFIDALGAGGTLDEASRTAFGKDYASILDMISVDR
jgi:hypothetical protein